MPECCQQKLHPDHSKQLTRLNRISGQLLGVKKMINDRRYCPDILAQLKAIRSGVKSLEINILEEHLKNCVIDAFESGNADEKSAKIDELKKLLKRFE